jgi:CheY-like chemotaxis protein
MERFANLIILVDDDADIREALSEVLEDRGFQVRTASNGQDALTLLRSLSAPPSAILLDLMMPIMDGYGFLEQHRNDPVLAAIPVAIITAGHAVDRTRIDLVTPIVPKPINVPKLCSTLHDLCGMGASAP